MLVLVQPNYSGNYGIAPETAGKDQISLLFTEQLRALILSYLTD